MGWLRPVFCGSVNEKVKFNTSLLGTNSIYNKNNKAKLYHWSIIVVFFKYYISATKIKKEIEKDMLNGQSVGLIFSYGFKKTWKYSLSIKLKHKSKNEIKKILAFFFKFSCAISAVPHLPLKDNEADIF